MRILKEISFTRLVFLSMLVSLATNLLIGYNMDSNLEQREFLLVADIEYDSPSTVELFFDTGTNFNSKERVSMPVAKGRQTIHIPFDLKEHGRLKFLRLDFGKEDLLGAIKIHSISLSTKEKNLFRLNGKEILHNISFSNGVRKIDMENLSIFPKKEMPFDAYIVLSPINEIIYPLWERVLLLIYPWLTFLFLSTVRWIRERIRLNEYGLLLSSLFLAMIPLKNAWLTFSALLLLAYACVSFLKTKRILLKPIHLSVILLFAVPLIFIGEGKWTKLAIPLGFVIFPFIASIIDFSGFSKELKKIFIKVFFVIMSIIITSWLILILHKGYYYGISFQNYFLDLKANVHKSLYWIYYDHPTFISFLILVGSVFCYELYQKRIISKTHCGVYMLFLCFVLPLIGSRFTIALALVLPLLFLLPVRNLNRIIFPLWLISFCFIGIFIEKLDPARKVLWELSRLALTENLWMGKGTGMSENLLPEGISIVVSGRELFMPINHSHNQFLTYLLENGVLGTMIITASLFYVLWHFTRQKNKTMLSITFLILMIMIIESPFKTATISYVVSFLLSVFSSVKASYFLRKA